MVSKEALVIGASIVGIQVSIDLANMGYKVHLVESTPSIGGRMAQLDKTFPTNDCSICILAPKMIECHQHPNIDCLTYSEVTGISGSAGDFKAMVRKKARYVDHDRCTGCGNCVEKCPKKVPNEFDMELGPRKAIYIPFPQAVPKKMTIDAENCIYLQKGKCRACEKACEANAIDFEQKDEVLELNVGAVVVCTGLDFYDMRNLPEYGYGKIANVVTAMEFERYLSASGPTLGHLKRPSDGKEPLKIGFIQCAGSRDVKHCLYCTGVCCMHSIKEAILTNEHNPQAESYIFYMDLRTAGKNFQEYLNRAGSEYNVNYIRSRPGRITENEKGDPVIWYEDTHDRKLRSLQVDLVVLAQALIASEGTKTVADTLSLRSDRFGFIEIPDPMTRPVDTSVKGIFACGFCQAPMDIPEGVAQASSAAARVAEMLEVMMR
jgi:heterodisulfide reductase subunit A